MKLNIKRITPLVLAGAIMLVGCRKTNGQVIHENNINNGNDTSIEMDIDEDYYESNIVDDDNTFVETNADDDNWEIVFSNNLKGSLCEVSKNLKISEDDARDYLRNLTGSKISFEACRDFYINRYEINDDNIGTLGTVETLYIDHNVVCRVNNINYVYIQDGEYSDISVVDALEQGVSLNAENLEVNRDGTTIYTRVYNDSNVTINSTDFTTEYEKIDHPDKDSFFNDLMLYPEFVDSFESAEDMKYEIDNYHDDSEYVTIKRVICGPDGNTAKDFAYFFCDNELLYGYAGDYNLHVYLPEDDESVSLDAVGTINNYLQRTNSSSEDLFTVHEEPGYSAEFTGKYSGELEKGHTKTY